MRAGCWAMTIAMAAGSQRVGRFDNDSLCTATTRRDFLENETDLFSRTFLPGVR